MTVFKKEMTGLQAEFLDFCLHQDWWRVIDHCGGWRNCAVGDFVHATRVPVVSPRGDDSGYECPRGFVSWTSFAEVIIPEGLYHALANCGNGFHTYGDLAEHIRTHYVEDKECAATPTD